MATINDLGMPNPITVGFGGTGVATNATPYGVICAGTTGTNPLQNIASVGTAGQVLTSNGAGALPTFQPATGGTVPNYTPVTSVTPVLNFGGSTTGITYTGSVAGHYMQIGALVTIWLFFQLSSKGSATGTAGIKFVGMPAPLTTNQLLTGLITSGGSGLPTGLVAATDAINNQIVLSNNTSTGSQTFLTNTNFANNTYVLITGSYMTS